jgi:hypothetical protein
MAEGTRESFAAVGRLPEGLIYPELVHSGMVETLVQNTDAFNEASRNSIRLVTQSRMGDFAQESFFKNISDLVSRRLVNVSPANPDVDAKAVPADEFISVKVNRRIGPVDQTLDSFKKMGQNPDFEVLSFLLGEQIAKAMQVEQLDTGLRSVVAAILGQAGLVTDGEASPPTTLDTIDLVNGLAKFGDAADRIVMWVMHSKPYYDLVKDQIVRNIDGLSNFNVASATPVTLNRPVLVTDSAALLSTIESPERSQYVTLGLTTNGVVLEDSEAPTMVNELVTGKQNIVTRLQGEFAYNVSCKGFKYDVTNGGVNPDDTTLATSTNWDSVMDSIKDLSGVAIQSF